MQCFSLGIKITEFHCNFNRSRPDPGQIKKINLNLCFHSSLCCLKMFDKTFSGTTMIACFFTKGNEGIFKWKLVSFKSWLNLMISQMYLKLLQYLKKYSLLIMLFLFNWQTEIYLCLSSFNCFWTNLLLFYFLFPIFLSNICCQFWFILKLLISQLDVNLPSAIFFK